MGRVWSMLAVVPALLPGACVLLLGEYHYALALVRGAAREDPRPAAGEALRLNPTQPEAIEAVRAFRTKSQAAWERRARRLPLYLR